MVLASAAKSIGVEAIVEGVSSFRRQIGQINDAIKGFGRDTKNVTDKAISPLNSLLGKIGESFRRVGEIVAGILIAGTLKKIADGLIDIAKSAIKAGAEFQSMLLRLENFIALDIFEAGDVTDFSEALTAATGPAKDLFFWVQRLALQSPFDIQDVSNLLTLAKSYGFATTAAQTLTESITDFAAGMGLEGDVLDRIIKAFGQMNALGKVTGQELLQLANAFVPVTDIQERMAENMGITIEDLMEMRKEGEITGQMFIDTFIEIVGERFPNAAERASQTFQGLTGNIKDLMEGLLGFNVVRPILDAISKPLSELLSALTEGDTGDKLIQITADIGESLAEIVGMFLQFGDLDTIADKVISFLQKVDGALVFLRDTIKQLISGDISLPEAISAILGGVFDAPQGLINFVDNVFRLIDEVKEKIGEIRDAFNESGLLGGLEAMGVPESIINFIEDILTAVDNLRIFWQKHGETIKDIFTQLLGALFQTGVTGGETVLEIFGNQIVRFSEFLAGEGGGGLVQGLLDFFIVLRTEILPALKKFFAFVSEHQDAIVNVILVVKALQSFVSGLVKIALVAGAILTAGSVIAKIGIIIFKFVGIVGALPIASILSLAAALAILVVSVKRFGPDAKAGFDGIKDGVTGLKGALRESDASKIQILGAWAQVIEGIIEVFANAVGAGEGFDKLQEFFGKVAAAIQDDGIVGGFKEAGSHIARKLWEGIGQFFNEHILPGIRFIFGDVLADRIKALFPQYKEAGENIVKGLQDGISNKTPGLLAQVQGLANQIEETFESATKMGSPSKIFVGFGQNLIDSLSMGMTDAFGGLIRTVRTVSDIVNAPAMGMLSPTTVNNSSVTTNNMNLTVNSSAASEQVVGDFQMMQALASEL